MTDSVNAYTNSTAAMALLKPTVSWAQHRSDRDRQLQYQAAITQDAQVKQAEAEQAAAATQQATSALYEVPFLEQDQNKWKDFVDTMLADNEKRIQTEFGGDRERYAKERYKQDLANMTLKATRSPLFKASLKRRTDVVQLMADQSKGLIDRPVTYRLNDGTMKTAPATQNYLDFQAGKTTDFTYQGGYAAPTKFNDFFSKNYSPSAAGDAFGKFKAIKANPTELVNAFISEDGMKGEDATDFFSRYGNRIGATWKFDPRDPYKEAGIKQRDRALGQGDVRNRISQQNADTNAARLTLDKQAQQGFNAYGITLDSRNITTTDANGLPTAVPATVQLDGKPQGNPWSLVGYDSQLIQPQIMAQLGIKPQRTKKGTVYSRGRLPTDAYVVATNKAGGVDLRRTDLKNLDYQIVGAGPVFRRSLKPDEQSAYQKAGGPETLYQQLTVRLTAAEAVKAKYGQLFRKIIPGLGGTEGHDKIDSITGAGAYREVDEEGRINKERTYDFDVVVPVTPTAATRVQMENTNPGRYMDSKAGSSSMSDYNSEQAPMNYNMFDDLDND
jgi:hypothetical protein